MQQTNYDVIIIGLGATGGAALYHLAKSGSRVLGLDQFTPPHNRGSSHGHTRIYRQAYFEAPVYVPMALRALELWHDLEAETYRRLFRNTGALTIAREDEALLVGARTSAAEHGIAHELLSREETLRRFPAFTPPRDTISLFEPTAGVLFADLCVETHLAVAKLVGAEMHFDECATSIEQRADGTVVVKTSKATYEAGCAIVAAGAWGPRLLNLEHAFHVTRETVHWFSSVSPNALADNCPVSLIALDDGRMFYSIPDFGDGFKAGLHHTGRTGDAHLAPEIVSAEDAATVATAMKQVAPGGAGALRASIPCFYTTTADQHFAIGPLPWARNIILAAACSGHGFKFAPAIGEAVAQMARGQQTAIPMDVFDVARLGAPLN